MQLLLRVIRKAALPALLLSVVAILSFSNKPGGEGFEVYLNNKLLLQQYGQEMNTMKNIRLESVSPEDQLLITYYHCGQLAKNRKIAIRDDQKKLLKEWQFGDAKSVKVKMSVPVKEILALKKDKKLTSLNLYYTSDELPAGRMLTTIQPTNEAVASIH